MANEFEQQRQSLHTDAKDYFYPEDCALDVLPQRQRQRHRDHGDGRASRPDSAARESAEPGGDAGGHGRPSKRKEMDAGTHATGLDYVPTPPIEIPRARLDLPLPGGYGEEGTSRAASTNGSASSSYRDDYPALRRSSITFASKVRHENGECSPLRKPLPRGPAATRRRSLINELTEAQAAQASPVDRSEPDEPGAASPGRPFRRRCHSARELRHLSQQPPSLLRAVVDDEVGNATADAAAASVQSLPAAPGSLTSDTTVSPVAEAGTPTHADSSSPPFRIGSPRSPRTWPAPSLSDDTFDDSGHPSLLSPLGTRAKSYDERRNPFTGRRLSARRAGQAISRRQTSPRPIASAFLSLWSNPSPLPGRLKSPTALPSLDAEGAEIGRYVLGRELGAGGFSKVREACTLDARQQRITRAVKIVRRRVPGKDELANEALQADFEHEYELWRRLNHKYVLPLKEILVTPFATFAFMDAYFNGTLFDLVRRNRASGLGAERSRRFAWQLASALRYLHEDMRIAHRDIKLENCLLDLGEERDGEGREEGGGPGKILLCDFGLAEHFTGDTGVARRRAIGPSETSANLASEFGGSLNYAAPEILEVATAAGKDISMLLPNPAVDVWAFGVCVYAMVRGDLPFRHALPPKVVNLILDGEWDRAAITERAVEFAAQGRGLGELVDSCLRRDDRWDIGDVVACGWFAEERAEEEAGEAISVWR